MVCDRCGVGARDRTGDGVRGRKLVVVLELRGKPELELVPVGRVASSSLGLSSNQPFFFIQSVNSGSESGLSPPYGRSSGMKSGFDNLS